MLPLILIIVLCLVIYPIIDIQYDGFQKDVIFILCAIYTYIVTYSTLKDE